MTPESVRHHVYTLLLVATVAATAGRVCNVELVFEPSMYRAAGEVSPPAPPRNWPKERPTPMPTFSSNDRSRWCAVRALVDHHTWVIGHRIVFSDGQYVDRGIAFEDGWKTVDKALNPTPVVDLGWIRIHEFHSTKPPLLTFLAACEYGLLKHLLGWEITSDTNLVVKTTLLTFNIAPLVIYLLMLRELMERRGMSDWGRLFAFTAACFGTFMTTFSTTLNNHTLAAVTVLAALQPLLITNGPLSPLRSLQAGFFAGLSICLELPAAAFSGMLFLFLLWRDPLRTLIFGLPVALLPIAVQFGLNYAAVGEFAPVYSKFGGPWYQYPGSHWTPPPPGEVKYGIDWARMHESIGVYWFHFLVGHHGLFSLTPIWLLSFGGIFVTLRQSSTHGRTLAALTLPVSLVVIGFYLVKSDNYGGWTSALRWLIWLSPLWLLTMLPVADRLASSTWGRRFGYALLAVSVFSAWYPALNPWRHPWLYHLLEARGLIPYFG